jgi:hypothetical protein
MARKNGKGKRHHEEVRAPAAAARQEAVAEPRTTMKLSCTNAR